MSVFDWKQESSRLTKDFANKGRPGVKKSEADRAIHQKVLKHKNLLSNEICVDVFDGNHLFLKRFASLNQAARYYGIPVSTAHRACGTDHPAKGFFLRYHKGNFEEGLPK